MKVKIKRVRGGSMGDQRQYGLVTGSVWNYENKPTTNNVGTTLSPVPRDEATIEAERGETVIGDLDNDGMVEHAKIGGKRHSQGGTPLNVPDGSFVFSDYRGLLIKNKDLLKGIFNMSSNKAVTPAKVAQRYDLNRYKMLLNDPDSDAMTKKTAQLMIDNNMKKLGQLALVQEGMKGFPDGVPAIALPLLGPDFQDPKQQGPQRMKKGGTVQYRKGGSLRRAQSGGEGWLPVDPQTGLPTKTLKGVEVVGEKDYGSYIDQLRKDWANSYNDHPIMSAVPGGHALLTLGNLFSTPQKSLMYGLTGRYDTPSNINPTRGLGNFQNSAMDVMQDIAFDPINFVGAVPELFGAGKKAVTAFDNAGKMAFGVSPEMGAFPKSFSNLFRKSAPAAEASGYSFKAPSNFYYDDAGAFYADAHKDLKALRERGANWDKIASEQGKTFNATNILHPEAIQYHGTYSGRPIVEVKMPDGTSEYFYKSTGWAGKSGAGVNGTTNGQWQVYGGKHLSGQGSPTSNWFLKDDGYKDYYGSKFFGDMANTMDDALLRKLNLNSIDELDNAVNFQNRNGRFDTFTPILQKKIGGSLYRHQGKNRSQVGFSSDLPDAGIVGYDQFGQPLYTDSQGTLASYFDPQTGQPVYYAGMMPEVEVVYQRTPEDIERAKRNQILANFNNYTNEYLDQMGQPTSGSGISEWVGPAALGTTLYGLSKSGPLMKRAWEGVKAVAKNRKALTTAFKNLFQTAPETIQGASGAYGEEEAVRRGLFNGKTIDNVKKVVSSPVFQLPAWIAGTYGINALTGYFDAPTNVKQLETKVQPGGGNDTTPAVNVPLVNTDSIAKMNQDTIDKIAILKKEFPKATDEEIIAYWKANPDFFNQYFLPTLTPSDSTKTDSTKVDSTKVMQPTNYNYNQAPKKEDKVVTPKPQNKVIKIKGVTGGGGNAVKMSKEDLLKNKSKRMEDEYMNGYKFGGSLNEYDRGGKTFTQYTEKSKITSNDDYDVIPVGQDIDYGFTVQKFDPNKGYYTITNPDTGQTIDLDLNDFMSRQGELVDGYNGGRNQWLKDATSRDQGTRKKAVHHFQTEYDKWRTANNLPTYFYGQPDENPYGVDDKFGIYTFSAPGIKKKTKKPVEQPKEQPEEPQPEVRIPNPSFQGATPYGLGDWFPSDVMAMNTAAAMRLPKYRAYAEELDPALMSPVYRNENYEPLSAVTQTVEGLGTGPQAVAAALGVQGKGLKAASDITAQTEALNTDQFLKTQAANMQAINQYGLGNRENRADLIRQLNVNEEATAKNANQQAALYASKFGEGYNHVLNQMLINATDPFQFQTPYSIAVNPTLRSIYDNPITGGSSGGSYDDVFNHYYKVFSQSDYGLNKKEAIEAANNAARNHLNTVYQRRRGTGTSGAILSPFSV